MRAFRRGQSGEDGGDAEDLVTDASPVKATGGKTTKATRTRKAATKQS